MAIWTIKTGGHTERKIEAERCHISTDGATITCTDDKARPVAVFVAGSGAYAIKEGVEK